MKICPQCKKHFEDSETMCPDCNVQLYKLKLKKKKKKTSTLKIVLIILASFFAFIVLGIVAFFGVSLYVAHKIVSSPEFSSGALRADEEKSNLKLAVSKINQSMTLRYALEGVTAKSFSDPHLFVENVFMKDSFEMVDSFTNPDVCNSPAFKEQFRGIHFCINNFATYDDRCDTNNQVPCAEDINAPSMYIDVNGPEGPNNVFDGSNQGADIFPFYIYAMKVIPDRETFNYMFDKKN